MELACRRCNAPVTGSLFGKQLCPNGHQVTIADSTFGFFFGFSGAAIMFWLGPLLPVSFGLDIKTAKAGTVAFVTLVALWSWVEAVRGARKSPGGALVARTNYGMIAGCFLATTISVIVWALR